MKVENEWEVCVKITLDEINKEENNNKIIIINGNIWMNWLIILIYIYI